MSVGRPGPTFGRANAVGLAPRGYSGPPGARRLRPGTFRPARRSLAGRLLSRGSPLRHMDWALTTAAAFLSAIGAVLVWAATEPTQVQLGADPRSYLYKQAIWIVVGLVLMFLVALVDYRQLRVYAPVVYGISLLSLLAVLVIGVRVNGGKSWIRFPAIGEIEPAEFAKIAIILMTAMLLAEFRDRATHSPNVRKRPRLRDALIVLVCGLPMVALVYKEPALGMAVVLLAIMGGLILLSGIRLWWVSGLVAVAVVAGMAVFKLHLLKSYQLQRLTSFLHPTAHAQGAGYNALEAKIAVGSGGMFGQGLFHGQSVTGSYVPEQSTDFIFTVAGQELGFVGCAVIVALLGIIVVRALRIASRADDLFGMLVASGVAIWFIVQSFISIGMTIGLTPVTGIPLPFVAYGGSAMFADMLAIGMLQSVHRKHRVFE